MRDRAGSRNRTVARACAVYVEAIRNTPLLVQIFLVYFVKSINVKSMADLAGKSVAVNRSTTQDTDLTQNAKGARVVRYDDDAGVITAVVTGQADLVGTSNALFQTGPKADAQQQNGSSMPCRGPRHGQTRGPAALEKLAG